jgi:low affinity Fe/Cu permease
VLSARLRTATEDLAAHAADVLLDEAISNETETSHMRAGLPIESFGTASHKDHGSWFSRMANATAAWTGKPVAFILAFSTIVVWGITGPLFHYSDTWQLVINTGTTIITFLMVFLIQNTQNRDTLALQVKLSELILALNEADNHLAAIENSSDEELQQANEEIKRRAAYADEHPSAFGRGKP